MSEEAAPAEGAPQDSTPPPAEQQQAPATGDDSLGDAGKKAIDLMKAERNAANSQAKALQRELDALKKAGLSESEKAIAEAEERGRNTAIATYGKRLAQSEYVAAAARRNPGFDAAGATKYFDMTLFLTEDGEPDAKAIEASVKQLVPEPDGSASFDGGHRGGSAPTSMDALIRGQLNPR